MPAFERIAHYRITGVVGRGGMGVVYSAIDERLDRPVAIKRLSALGLDSESRARVWREARAAAAINHPNICQVHEVGEQDDALFIVMELLEGVSLAKRLSTGPVSVDEAVQMSLGLLAALEALHGRGFVHRDVKPSNLFLTQHGVKLVDFGLAKPVVAADPGAFTTRAALTQPGAVAGTPQYMSPEQLQGEPVDARSDLFAAGAVLYEMLTGRPPFNGRTVPELFHAIVYESPATLTGPAAILQPIVLRALAKRPQDRFQNAQAMGSQLRTLQPASPTQTPASVHSPFRLIVLPFYQLREDEETSFLCFSLPDAISSSLTGLRSLVVRSSRVASRYSGQSIDLRAIAQETEVDAVVTGTLLRAGDQIRASVQLLEAPGGTVVWTHSTQVRLDDIFQFQDGVVKAIVASLALPLTERERTVIAHDVPASARAYEFYLRANQLSNRIRDLSLARDMYLQCLDEDPKFAPAWARLARCYRVLAKYGADPVANMNRADESFGRAFALNPDLAMAHSLYAQHEAEHGRSERAIVRLLEGVQWNRNDPELYAGLVHVCRYVGLVKASLTAHELARRVDPNTRTTVMNTHFAMGNFQLALEASVGDVGFMEAMVLEAIGRRREALACLRRSEEQDLPPLLRRITEMMKLFLANDRERAAELLHELNLQGVDPEGFFYRARLLSRLGEIDEATRAVERAVEGGFWCVPALLKDTYLEPIRTTTRFHELVHEADRQAARVASAFQHGGGDNVLSASDHSGTGTRVSPERA